MRSTAHAALLLLSAALHSATASASTFVRMGERELVAASVGAVRGRVTRIATAADPTTGSISTYVWIQPSGHLFGRLPPGTLVLREPGGRTGDHEQRVFGSPEYRVGESVLVFLSRSADGALHTTGLSLGKFSLRETDGATHAVRRYGADVALFDPRTGTLDTGADDDTLELSDLLERMRSALAVRTESAGPVRRIPPELRRLSVTAEPAFVLFNPAVRWFEADAGTAIGYAVDTTGDATLGPPASRAAVDAGMAAWTGVAGASIILQDAGDAGPAPLGGCPDQNRIVFNDPFGEIDPPANCEGALAITLVCDGNATETVNGTLFHQILSGKITFNDGFGACPFWNACNLGEIATHELGHTVGLAHSDFSSATMAAKAHFDGRCAGITSDDAKALAFVYPASPSPSPTPTRTPSPAATATITRTGTVTRTLTQTAIPTRTLSPTVTMTPSRMPTRSRTPTATATATASAIPSASSSATTTATASPTLSASPTPTASLPPTASPEPAPTQTPPPRPDQWLAALIRAVQQLLTLLSAARAAA